MDRGTFAKLGWVLWIMRKSLSLLSHRSVLTQVVVSHMGMCLSYLLYAVRDIYFSLLNSEGPAGSIGTQTVSQGNFGLAWGNGQWGNRCLCQQSTWLVGVFSLALLETQTEPLMQSWNYSVALLWHDLASAGYNLCHCSLHSSSTYLEQKVSQRWKQYRQNFLQEGCKKTSLTVMTGNACSTSAVKTPVGITDWDLKCWNSFETVYSRHLSNLTSSMRRKREMLVWKFNKWVLNMGVRSWLQAGIIQSAEERWQGEYKTWKALEVETSNTGLMR